MKNVSRIGVEGDVETHNDEEDARDGAEEEAGECCACCHRVCLSVCNRVSKSAKIIERD